MRRKKKTETKKLQVALPRFEPAPQLSPAENVKPGTTGPCENMTCKINSLYVFFCQSDSLNLWRSIYHEFKDTFKKK